MAWASLLQGIALGNFSGWHVTATILAGMAQLRQRVAENSLRLRGSEFVGPAQGNVLRLTGNSQGRAGNRRQRRNPSPAFERVKESMFSFRTARGHPAHADEFRSNLTRWTCRYACPRPLDGLMGGDAVASGRLRPQAVRSHQIIGERMQQCNRRAFDQSANRHEAEAMVLAVSVEPLDQLAELVNGLPRRTRHPTAPFLDAVGFAPPFAFSVPQRCRAYVGIRALDRQRCID